jgi:hypothetical protein
MAVAGLVLVTVAGCKSGEVKNNATVNANEQAAQALVQKCASTANFLTAGGRQKFYHCLAPNGGSAAVQKCATTALAHDGVLTKRARQHFYADVSKCILPATPAPTKKGKH